MLNENFPKLNGSIFRKQVSSNDKLEQDFVLERIRSSDKALPDALSDTIKNVRSTKPDHPIRKVLKDVRPERCEVVSRV